MARPTIYLLILAIIAPYLYDRYLAVSNILANRPGKFKKIYNIKSHELKFRDRIRNCEDVVLDEGMGLAFLSCDPGRDRWNTVMGTMKPEDGWENGGLWIYDYSSGLPDSEALKPLSLKKFFNANNFHPLGIEYEVGTSTLYVVNHARNASVIEMFKVFAKAGTATHIGTLKHDLIHAPNSIHALGDGKLFVTNDHYFHARLSPLLSNIETWAGVPIASVVYVDVNKPETGKIVARLPFANGVTMLNSTTLAVGASSKAGVYFYEVTPEHDLKSKGYFRTPSGVDNISVDGNGKLLLAGHPFAPALVELSQRRGECYMDRIQPGPRIPEDGQLCACDSPSWAAEWTQEDGLKELYKGLEICSSSTVVRDASRGVGIVSALYDRGIMVFKE